MDRTTAITTVPKVSQQQLRHRLLIEAEELELQIMRVSVLAAAVKCEDMKMQRLILCHQSSTSDQLNPAFERMRQQLNQLTARTIMTGQQIVSDCLAGPDDPRDRTVAG
jgi:hypothetical protein